MLGISSSESIINIITSIIKKDTVKSIDLLNIIFNDGKDMFIFLQDFIKGYRNLMVAKINSNCDNLINASDEDIQRYKNLSSSISIDRILSDIRILQDTEKDFKYSSNQKFMLEMAIIKMTEETGENILLNKIETLSKMLKSLPAVSSSGKLPEIIEKIEEIEDTPYSEEVLLTIKLNDAKTYVIDAVQNILNQNTLDPAKQVEKQKFVDSLKNSKISMDGKCICLEAVDEVQCENLMSNNKNLVNGFSKALNEPVNVDILLF
jgi:DNA polymerase-3 subunit gamma/tau